MRAVGCEKRTRRTRKRRGSGGDEISRVCVRRSVSLSLTFLRPITNWPPIPPPRGMVIIFSRIGWFMKRMNTIAVRNILPSSFQAGKGRKNFMRD
jgi:hypothetical protein